MFKKLVVASAVLALSSSVFAGANYKGEYKGEQPAPCPTYTYTAGPYLGASIGPRTNGSGTPTYFRGFNGTLFAGYGAFLTPAFYLAGEIFGQGDANIKDETFNGNGSKTSWGYGASIIPGYLITDHVLGYLRAGAVRSRFPDQGNNATAWQVGLGGQTNLYQNWDLRGEYVFSNYGSISGVGHVTSDQFNLGIVYKFV